jgi:hypothetical protein
MPNPVPNKARICVTWILNIRDAVLGDILIDLVSGDIGQWTETSTPRIELFYSVKLFVRDEPHQQGLSYIVRVVSRNNNIKIAVSKQPGKRFVSPAPRPCFEVLSVGLLRKPLRVAHQGAVSTYLLYE